MKKIDEFLQQFIDKILKQFQKNVIFIGLQGSYARGEADANSDVDIVCVLQHCSFAEIILYKQILTRFAQDYKMCGFLGGQNELLSWSAGDLFQLYRDTLPLYGNLDFLQGRLNKQAVQEMIKVNSCNLYHGCVHNYLYDNSKIMLKEFFKTAVFIVKAKYYYQYQQYIRKHKDLLESLDEQNDRLVVQYYYELKADLPMSKKKFEQLSSFLYQWSKENILNC